MAKELLIKKCNKCGSMVEVYKDCNCLNDDIVCCGEPMQQVKPNSVEASVEKHLPQYEIIGDYIVVTVPHVMEENHYIEFICLKSNKINAKKYFKPFETAKAVFPYIKGSTIFAYCNIHGLWETEVK